MSVPTSPSAASLRVPSPASTDHDVDAPSAARAASRRSRGPADVSATSSRDPRRAALRIITRLRAVTDDAVVLTRSKTRTPGG